VLLSSDDLSSVINAWSPQVNRGINLMTDGIVLCAPRTRCAAAASPCPLHCCSTCRRWAGDKDTGQIHGRVAQEDYASADGGDPCTLATGVFPEMPGRKQLCVASGHCHMSRLRVKLCSLQASNSRRLASSGPVRSKAIGRSPSTRPALPLLPVSQLRIRHKRLTRRLAFVRPI
jgi:hypothetical protein